MKIERVTSESSAIFHTVNADKILKDEKQIFDADAVVLDSDRQKQSQYQAKEETEKEKQEKDGEKPSDAEAKLPLGKKVDIVA